jgi:acyl transferase domain-containing protein/acyl carrier protein
MNNSTTFDHKSGLEIAIIGMSGRFPGARNIDEFWRNLRDGVESISFFTDQELESSGINPVLLNNPNYVKAKGVLQDIELFDASFFGFNPREAEIMDPQHRIFLECAWEALEGAGYDPEKYKGLIGVYAGVHMNSYLLNNLYSNRDLIESVGDFETMIGNDKDFVTTRVSYKLGLKGPSVVVQTACSTSLVAVCLACQCLLSGECDIALAGGASINAPQKGGYLYYEGGIPSRDGHCRAFDVKAQGTVWGDGVGIVVLKRLGEALADGDCIHAVIKGSAINNDGSFKVGYTAPRLEGQAMAIRSAQIMSEVDPETITYIETHGTGTSLGDPIEIAALTQAFRASTQKKGFCAIGSVKTNVGHMEQAAGVASLIKTVLALRNKMIPPILHFEKPNPKIDFASSPFYVNAKLSEWKADGFPRRAGVSSFGVGGTNAHVVLEEAPIVEASGKSRPWQLLLLSAQTSTALDKMTTNLVEHLKQHPHLNLADVAYTLNKGRKAFDYRRMIVCQSLNDVVTTLETLDPERVLTSFQEPINRDIVFMFSGQGAQYVNMGLELYRTESQFQEEVDRCSEILKTHLSLDLRDILYPDEKDVEKASQKLKKTLIIQPALFVIEYALAKLWQSWGVHPTALVGHSIGEYVAACLAGVFSLEDALALVATRGRLMQELPGGSMLAVPLSEKEIQPFLNRKLSLSAINSPSFCVVSGEKEAVQNLEEQLCKKNVVCRHLHTSHAFHSEMMDPILDAFTEQVKQINFNPLQISFVSTVTGTWITSDEIMNPGYWAKNLRQTVRFSDCVQELLKEPNRLLLEVGPGHTLSTLARQHPNKSKKQIVLSSIRHPKEQKSDIAFILNTLGRLWLAGIHVDWSGFYEDKRRHRLPLPTYPFERQRYWVEPQQQTQPVVKRQRPVHKKSDIAEWLYFPSWKRSVAPKQLSPRAWSAQKLCWLLFVDECGLGSKLVKQLERQGQEVIVVQAGGRFESVRNESYTINPKSKDDYHALIKELHTLGKLPQKIIHLWSVTPNDYLPSGIESFNRFQELGFYSLIFLTQALVKQHVTQAIEFEVVTNHVQEVIDEGGLLCAEKATVLGPCKVIPQEYANITCRSIDLGVGGSEENRIEQLVDELTARPTDSTVAYRGKHRWVQIFEPVKLKGTVEARPWLREGGVYLITGGLGGLGMALAEYLAGAVKARLILTGRSGLPAKEQWQQWLSTHPEGEPVSRKIRKVQALEKLGAEVLIISADVANEDQMQRGIAQAKERFGAINGVIHAAGIVGEASIQEVSRGLCEQQFQSKVNGLFVLEKALEGKAIDFCLLTSSLSSVLGGLGFAGYAAANVFMDAFTHRHNQAHSVPWISVNWDAWQFQDETEQNIGPGTDLAELAIKPKEGREAFQRILSLDLGTQIVVSTGDLQARLDKWIKLESLREPEQKKKAKVPSGYCRPALSSVYVVPGNPTEQTIVEIWQELLGIEKVGIHDNFFELGGHSLLATQVINRLRSAFPIEFSVSTLFERPTVHSLSQMILDGDKGAPSFTESRSRGQKRKERKRQRMVPEQGKRISCRI